jgi:carboxypeptidase Taq
MSDNTTSTAYSALTTELQQIAILGSCGSLVSWDEQTCLPPRGTEFRAEQLSLLAGLRHERATSKKLADMIAAAEDELGSALDDDTVQAANVREARRDFSKATRLPQRLVEEITRATSHAHLAWVNARKASSFSQFLPSLKKVIHLKQEEASALRVADQSLYDALLDNYEPYASSAEIEKVFAALREQLVPLVKEISASSVKAPISILSRFYPIDQQKRFCEMASAAVGFDMTSGRLDVSAHPFCSGIAPGDCRMTTRYEERHFNSAFFGVLHETGHGLYEQGLIRESFGMPCGETVSLGIHESQSRMWENFVGRSLSFWTHFYPQAQQHFPHPLGDVNISQFYSAINDIRPTFIRVEADEVTYNLHIMLRFELEQAMMSGDLPAEEIPAAWNKKIKDYLGIKVPSDAMGCLQDVHWSAGLIGYFPTYALGNMYAAQLFQQAATDLGDLDRQFENGDFKPLLEWLRSNIHHHGRRYSAAQLIERITKKPLSHQPLIDHLRNKLAPLYDLSQT